MSCPYAKRHLLVLFCALLLSAVALAAPRAILPFTATTWGELQHAPTRPLAVVFSTTDCAHCPKAIDALAEAMRKSRSGARLAVVVMDGAGQEEMLRADPHYRRAQALYAFEGDATALRYAVNPDWRGLTPYVVLIPAGGAPRYHVGAPSTETLHEFLRR